MSEQVLPYDLVKVLVEATFTSIQIIHFLGEQASVKFKDGCDPVTEVFASFYSDWSYRAETNSWESQ